MSEDFVSFDLAKKLKKKGFPQYTEKSYFVGDHKKRMCSVGTFLHVHTQNTEHLIAAPTIAQVLKWLRERDIQVAPWYHRIKKQWSCAVSYNNGEYNTILYNDYTDAAMSGIEYVIDNLI